MYDVERSDLSFNNFAGNNNNIVVYGVGRRRNYRNYGSISCVAYDYNYDDTYYVRKKVAKK